MPMSTDVILPLEQEPVYPSVCVRCLTDRADHTVKFSGRRISWLHLFFFWLWWMRRPVRTEVPCCVDCRAPIRRRRWLEFVGYTVITVVAVVILMPWLKSIGASRDWQKLGVLAGVLVIGAPFFFWTVVRPPAFDLTVREHVVEYEFARREYARRFADLNPGYTSEDLDWEEEFEREWREEHGDDWDDDDDEWDEDDDEEREHRSH